MFDSLLQAMVMMLLVILLLGLLLKKLNQPYLIAYIIAGILLGPWSLNIVGDADTITAIGEMGLVIQMFFIGAEIEIRQFAKNFRKPLVAVFVQLLLSVAFIWLLGSVFSWSGRQIIIFSFVISLSSSAIILEYIQKNKELTTPLGTLTTGILVLQDFLIVPMLFTMNYLALKKMNFFDLVPLLVASVLMIVLQRKAVLRKKISFPFPDTLTEDHELQVFAGLLICFGLSWLTSLLHISAAMGALMAGILIGRSSQMRWLEHNLKPFRVFFLSLFFLSIGLQLNVSFLLANIVLILFIVAIILLINSLINVLVFRLLKISWQNSFYAGALLSLIGECSLVLGKVG